jgi:hypothetical protein
VSERVRVVRAFKALYAERGVIKCARAAFAANRPTFALQKMCTHAFNWLEKHIAGIPTGQTDVWMRFWTNSLLNRAQISGHFVIIVARVERWHWFFSCTHITSFHLNYVVLTVGQTETRPSRESIPSEQTVNNASAFCRNETRNNGNKRGSDALDDGFVYSERPFMSD